MKYFKMENAIIYLNEVAAAIINILHNDKIYIFIHLKNKQVLEFEAPSKEVFEKLCEALMGNNKSKNGTKKYTIDDLALSIQACKSLKEEKILTLKRLLQHSERDLYMLPKMGKTVIREIKNALAILGLKLKND